MSFVKGGCESQLNTKSKRIREEKYTESKASRNVGQLCGFLDTRYLVRWVRYEVS